MRQKTVLIKNGLFVSEDIVNRLNPNRQSLKEKIEKISKPYDVMQYGKRRNSSKLNPKIISKLSKVINKKTELDLITKDEYTTMENKLKDIVNNWILT